MKRMNYIPCLKIDVLEIYPLSMNSLNQSMTHNRKLGTENYPFSDSQTAELNMSMY